MAYEYSPEVMERFKAVDLSKETDFQAALEECLGIIRDYSNDDSVLAAAYYFAAEMSNSLSDEANSIKYCELSIAAARNSGYIRFQILATNMLALIKLNQMNEAQAAEYLYNALSLAIRNQENDLLDTIYTNLGHTYASVEDHKTAIYYYNLGIDGFVSTYENGKLQFRGIYGSRILCCAMCYVALKKVEELKELYNELVEIDFGSVMPTYAVTMTFLHGYIEYLTGNTDSSKEIFQQLIEEFSELETVMDVYELLLYVFDVFMQYDMEQELTKIIKLMEHFSSTIDVKKCKSQYTLMLIKYCKYIGDNEGLLRAYNDYYDIQQAYTLNNIMQRQTNIMLRKRLFEETEENRKRLLSLQTLSETDELTGLYNRHSLVKSAKEILENALEQQHTFGVILLDIDRYKGYNDTFGHIQGDVCLKEIARVCMDVLRGFFCARYGGDEFVCVFSNVSREEIEGYCKLLRAKIEELNLSHPENKPYGIVTISQGVTVRIPTEQDDFAVFVHEADQCLYNSKGNGRNTIAFY